MYTYEKDKILASNSYFVLASKFVTLQVCKEGGEISQCCKVCKFQKRAGKVSQC